jgi:hypothetical protein
MLRAPQRLLIAIALVLLGFVAQPGAVAAQAQNDADNYVAGIPDLPLKPGLEALPDSGVVFDKPGGRIVEAFAQGDVSPQSVTAFYDETLPQLGWQREAPGVYLREGERLQLAFSQDAGRITVHFRLLPQ